MTLLPPKYQGTWEIYAVLLFLGFFFFYFPQLSATEIAFSIIGLLTFLPLYFYTHWRTGLSTLIPIFSVVGLGFILSPINPGASVFFTYAAGLSGLLLRGRVAIAITILIGAVFIASCLVLQRPVAYLLGHVFLVVVVAAIYMQVRRSELSTERLLRREEEIEALTAYSERRRITADLHDVLGQTFSLINVKAALCRKLLISDPEKAFRELDDLAEAARSALEQVRATIYGYDMLVLVDELTVTATHLDAAGIALTINRTDLALSSSVDAMLALILRECVTNIVRHSKARKCTIDIRATGSNVEMIVADNGVGFVAGDGRGLRGITERAARIGGEVDIDNSNGTKIRVSIPGREES